MITSFTEVNQRHQDQFGHLMEGVSHRSNEARLNQLEQNKLGILMDNSVKQFCMSHKLPGDSLATIKEAMNTSADAVTFVKTQLPLVRRVFINSVVRQFVSIQPMSQPDMKIHYYDVVRDDDSSLADEVHTNRGYANNVEYDANAPTAIKNLRVKITGSSITAVEKKLKADWTVESQDDIMAYHGVNVESDLSNALGTEITCEWDRTMIEDMYQGATGGAKTFDQTVPNGITYTDKKVWMEGLMEAMIDVDTQIFKKRYRKTNWIVCSPEIGAFLEKMQTFVADPTAVDQKIISSGGRYFSGTLAKKWSLYIDPFFYTNKILMGYNGSGDWLDTCYVFAPYIIAFFSQTFLNPSTFVNTRAILSRAAKKLVVPDLLGIVTISGS